MGKQKALAQILSDSKSNELKETFEIMCDRNYRKVIDVFNYQDSEDVLSIEDISKQTRLTVNQVLAIVKELIKYKFVYKHAKNEYYLNVYKLRALKIAYEAINMAY